MTTWREVCEWAAWNNVTDAAVVIDQVGNVVTSIAPSIDDSRVCVHTAEHSHHPVTWGEVRDRDDLPRGASVWVFFGTKRETPVTSLEWQPGFSPCLMLR